jgi:hypothetical protein
MVKRLFGGKKEDKRKEIRKLLPRLIEPGRLFSQQMLIDILTKKYGYPEEEVREVVNEMITPLD